MIPELDSSPWVMAHGDLSATNIITDSDNNLSGLVALTLINTLQSALTKISRIIDLGFAEYLPLQFAAVFPIILDHESCQDQHDIDVAPELVQNPESSLVWRSKNTETKRRDRQLFVDTVKNLCNTYGDICETFYRVLTSKDEIRRYWWFLAVSNQKLHQAMVKVKWLVHGAEFANENLSNEWQLFQMVNPGH